MFYHETCLFISLIFLYQFSVFLNVQNFKQKKNSLQDFLYGKILFIWHAGTSNTLLFCVYFLYALENTYLREVSNFVLLNEIKVFEFYQNRRLTVVSFYEDNHIFLVNNRKQKNREAGMVLITTTPSIIHLAVKAIIWNAFLHSG